MTTSGTRLRNESRALFRPSPPAKPGGSSTMHARTFPVSRFLLISCLCLLLAFVVTGCGPSMASVSGKVYYKDKALNRGNVQFADSEGKTYDGKIEQDGSYSAKVRTGELKVGIVSVDDDEMIKYGKSLAQAGREGKSKTFTGAPPRPKDGKKTWSVIPEKYNNPQTSGLTKTIKSGKNSDVDFKLD
jgi:hypothetical protein